MAVARPENEADRLLDVAELARLDQATDDLLGAFVRVASDLVGAPICGVSLVGEDEQFFKALRGLEAGCTPRDSAFCAHAILSPGEVMVVPDLQADPRFRSNALVTGDPNLRFYAGAPLFGRRGNAVGTLCVLDQQPRSLTPEMVERLRDLARGASAALSLRRAIGEVHRAARTDTLTGLLNRAGMAEALAEEDARELCIVMIDLDGFKPINDTYGHAGGDKALAEVARRLVAAVREGDKVARPGGDEFVVLARGLGGPAAGMALARRIHASLADTFVLNGSTVPLRASIGFAAGQREDAATLMERADAALYEAKRAGRGVTRAAEARPARGTIGRAALEERLQRAFGPGGEVPFHLVFQPIIDIAAREVRSAEALLRWRTDTGLMLDPAEVLPVIESMGYSGALDRWVIGEACRLIAAGDPPFPISVNASASTFGIAGFDAQVAAIQRAHGVPGDRLRIEMTERSLTGDPQAALGNVEGLARMGVRVVLDDFGGGHGTLARLRGFPFSAIKIDRGLVTDCARDQQGTALLEAVVGMARALSIPAVAEGVDDAGQLVLLARLGVNAAQGFLLAQPSAWEELAAAGEAACARARDILDVPAAG